MNIDLSKVIFTSGANAFKNDDQVYTGSMQIPTSLSAFQIYTAAQVVTLNTPPAYSKFFAFCWEYADLKQAIHIGSGYTGQTWYPASVGGNSRVGVQFTAPSTIADAYLASIYPVISGNTITVNFILPNQNNAAVTVNGYTIFWAFVTYSLAN